jgi:hypothetical protein
MPDEERQNNWTKVLRDTLAPFASRCPMYRSVGRLKKNGVGRWPKSWNNGVGGGIMPVPADWSEKVKAAWESHRRLPDRFGREYDEIFCSFVCEEAAPAESMDDFRGWVNDLSGKWGFRGQRESRWTLQTSRIVR